MHNILQDFNCPMCGNRDHVLLVDTLVQGGSERVRSRHVCREPAKSEVIQDQPALAKKLHPPKDHLLPSWIGFILIVSLFLITLFLLCVRHPKLLAFDLQEVVHSIGALDMIILLLLLPIVIVSSINLILAITRRPRLFEKIQKWHALYYCTSHDIVFMPGSKTHVPPSKMRQLL